jgi:2-keto-4-pentenoate hydratase
MAASRRATQVAGETPATDPSASDDARAETGFLVVVGPAKGRRRAGRPFGPTPERIAIADLSEDEILAIEADPELACHREEGDA